MVLDARGESIHDSGIARFRGLGFEVRGGPHNKDENTIGSILAFPYFDNVPNKLHGVSTMH